MKDRTRKPTHPGKILEELYIKPLKLSFQELADHLGISRNTLFKIRSGKAGITPALALRLAEAFNTTPAIPFIQYIKHSFSSVITVKYSLFITVITVEVNSQGLCKNKLKQLLFAGMVLQLIK